jgi:hypothetical protein
LLKEGRVLLTNATKIRAHGDHEHLSTPLFLQQTIVDELGFESVNLDRKWLASSTSSSAGQSSGKNWTMIPSVSSA